MNGNQTEPTLNPAPQPPAVVETKNLRSKSVVLACVLSGMPGLGQIYVGYYQRGFVHAIVAPALLALSFGLPPDGGLVPMLMFLVFFWLYNIVDAGRRADLYNQNLLGNKCIELPEDLKMPGIGGSIVGGLLVVTVSSILLLHTRFHMPLDWIREWWPVAGVLLGLYLLVKGIRERKAKEADAEVG